MLKPINKTSTAVFAKIIEMVEATDRKYMQIDNSSGSFMAVSAERLYETEVEGHEAVVYSLAHYYKQNGDLVPDPDMTFLLLNGSIFPLTYQDGRRYDEAVRIKGGKISYFKSQYASLLSFSNMWLRNIKFQQNIKP